MSSHGSQHLPDSPTSQPNPSATSSRLQRLSQGVRGSLTQSAAIPGGVARSPYLNNNISSGLFVTPTKSSITSHGVNNSQSGHPSAAAAAATVDSSRQPGSTSQHYYTQQILSQRHGYMNNTMNNASSTPLNHATATSPPIGGPPIGGSSQYPMQQRHSDVGLHNNNHNNNAMHVGGRPAAAPLTGETITARARRKMSQTQAQSLVHRPIPATLQGKSSIDASSRSEVGPPSAAGSGVASSGGSHMSSIAISQPESSYFSAAGLSTQRAGDISRVGATSRSAQVIYQPGAILPTKQPDIAASAVVSKQGKNPSQLAQQAQYQQPQQQQQQQQQLPQHPPQPLPSTMNQLSSTHMMYESPEPSAMKSHHDVQSSTTSTTKGGSQHSKKMYHDAPNTIMESDYETSEVYTTDDDTDEFTVDQPDTAASGVAKKKHYMHRSSDKASRRHGLTIPGSNPQLGTIGVLPVTASIDSTEGLTPRRRHHYKHHHLPPTPSRSLADQMAAATSGRPPYPTIDHIAAAQSSSGLIPDSRGGGGLSSTDSNLLGSSHNSHHADQSKNQVTAARRQSLPLERSSQPDRKHRESSSTTYGAMVPVEHALVVKSTQEASSYRDSAVSSSQRNRRNVSDFADENNPNFGTASQQPSTATTATTTAMTQKPSTRPSKHGNSPSKTASLTKSGQPEVDIMASPFVNAATGELQPISRPFAPYVLETEDQLMDLSTVPREVYKDYFNELRKKDSKTHDPEEVPREVEFWTVKLPTRLEFKHITLRVLKKFPKKGSKTAAAAEAGMSKKKKKKPAGPIAGASHLHQQHASGAHAAHGKGQAHLPEFEDAASSSSDSDSDVSDDDEYETSRRSSSALASSSANSASVRGGYEFDLEAPPQDPSLHPRNSALHPDDPNNNSSHEVDEDELFSPSAFAHRHSASGNTAATSSTSTAPAGRQNNHRRRSNGADKNANGTKLAGRSSLQKHISHQNAIRKVAAAHHPAAVGPMDLFKDSDDDEDEFVDAEVLAQRKSSGPALPCLGNSEFETRAVTILDDLSGVIEPGHMVAIMGASGAGKTTLLNTLSGRAALSEDMSDLNSSSKPASVGGVYFNGSRVSEAELGSMTGYVMQNDVFLGTLTPRETLQFAAELQLPPSINETRRLKRVEKIIQQLDLQHIADTPIGGHFQKGISGGQKRRVSVGIELVRDPNVIFLDEPTSGLDATTAVNVMRVLKHLAQTGRTVIFTIHSPNSKILELFDTLILLSRGKLAYFGPAQKALPYFGSLGYECPLHSNAAEFYLNVLQINTMGMFRTMLYNAHHTPEDVLTPFDPRWKSVVLLRAQLGLFDGKRGGAPANSLSSVDYAAQFMSLGFHGDDDMFILINGQTKETLRQRRRRHLIKQLHTHSALLAAAYTHTKEILGPGASEEALQMQTNEIAARYWNFSLLPQSPEVYHNMLLSEDGTAPYPVSSVPSLQHATLGNAVANDANRVVAGAVARHLEDVAANSGAQPLYDVEKIILDREDKRLTMITDMYLRHPVPVASHLSPFLTDYMPKLRTLDSSEDVALSDIGFDTTVETTDGRIQRRKLDLVAPGAAPLPYTRQLAVLTVRTFLHTMRDPLNTVARVIVNLFLSLFVGFLFFQCGTSQKSLYSRVGFLFFMSSIQSFITVMGAVLTFSEERALFLREYQKQIYSTSAYFLGKAAIDFVLQTVLAFIFGSVAYPMVGLQANFGKFIQYSVMLIMTAHGAHSYALVLGATIPYRTVALMLAPVIVVPHMLSSGFFCPLSKLPVYLKYTIALISPQRFSFEAMMNVEFDNLTLHCTASEYITVPLDTGTLKQVCPVTDGGDVMTLFGLNQNGNCYVINFFALIAITVVVKLIALGCLQASAWWTVRTSTGA